MPTLWCCEISTLRRASLTVANSFSLRITFAKPAGTFSPVLVLDYTIFDFGRRLQEVAISRSNLLAANFLFNDTHRKIIFQVMAAYYRVLNSKGQEDAQEANLKNAQTVQDAAEARLHEGLATLPDVLEARSAAAQADYDLQAAIGATEIAHGDLATALSISPTSKFQVESIQNLTIPQDLTDTVETSIDRALAQRPDLMQQVEQLRAAGDQGRKDCLSANAELRFQRRPGPHLRTTEFWAGTLLSEPGDLGCKTQPDLEPV
jgi:outer membrane protein TolC